MAIHCKDGAWLTLQKVAKLGCSKCGYTVTDNPTNEQEEDELIREHARTHGGIDRG